MSWLLHAAAFAWGLAEATLFYIVPDVLLMLIGAKRGARAGAVASLCAAIGAGVGGALMFVWSAHDAAAAREAVLAVPAVSEAMFEAARGRVAEEGWFAAALGGPLSFTPYKIYAVLAPAADAHVWGFALASVLARLPRFLILSLAAAGARRLLPDAAWLPWAVGASWIAFYLAFFALTPN